MAYEVTSPLVQVRRQDGSYVHLYEGALLPDEADPKHVEQLLADGMIAEADAPAVAPDASDHDDRPSGNASAEEWRAYAVAHGMSEEEAESLSRNELRDRFAS